MGVLRLRDTAVALLATLSCLALLASCSSSPATPVQHSFASQIPTAAPGPSWAPKGVTTNGLTSLATSDHAHGFRLHTVSGDKTFIPGMNLGSTTPLHQPGELAIGASDYHRWFAEMGAMGVRAVRIYTIHPPAFYNELAAYDTAHPDAPIYLVQGVYLPDESYIDLGRTLYDASVDQGFTSELNDASAAVHGDFKRAPTPGHASGTWTTDVSPWLMSWIIGVEWDPLGVRRTNRRDANSPYTPGKYFAATRDASPTERWIARHMETIAEDEAARGQSAPIAFANWPTADPLHHPDEPLNQEDLVSVDAQHVLPTKAWPGGTFASFHAYPYYPDFMRHEKALWKTTWQGRPDAYAGYLQSLKRHFTKMPLLITEFGVPSSLGSAHLGTNGRDQGGHTEQQAMAIDANLLRLIKAQGVGAGFVFEWTDEWFKRTWNTEEHQLPGQLRRQLWHDALTNEQWFGAVATDSDRILYAAHDFSPPSGPLKVVHVDADATYVYLDVTAKGALPKRLVISANTVPGPQVADYRIDVDLARPNAQVYVRAALDPIRLDTSVPDYQPDVSKPWHRFRLIINRALTLHGKAYAPEFQDVGHLVEGSWDPSSPRFDSLSTWRRDGNTVRLRVPWGMLGMADPSSRLALGEGNPAKGVKIKGIGLTFDADGQRSTMTYSWPPWNYLLYTERPKAGIDVLAKALRQTAER